VTGDQPGTYSIDPETAAWLPFLTLIKVSLEQIDSTIEWGYKHTDWSVLSRASDGLGPDMQKRSEQTKTQLLGAALKQFAVHGYDATSVEDICTAAGVSKGAFYHHFESKHALFLSLLKSWLEVIRANLVELQKPTVPETMLNITEMMPGILETARDQLPMFLEFWLHASRDKSVWKATIEPYHEFREYFASLIEQGIREGSLRDVDPRIAGETILSMAVGILLQALLEPQGTDWGKATVQGMEIVMKGLAR